MDAASQELRIRHDRHSSGLYLVKASGATITEPGGATLAFSALQPGDFVIVTGAVDGNLDITATRIVRLLTPNHQPPPGGHPGPGTGGTPLPPPPPPPPGTVFAGGAIGHVDPTANTFVLRRPFRGPLFVRYSETQLVDARVRPPQPTTENALLPNASGDRFGEVAGQYIAPSAATNNLPGIDASGQGGRVIILR